VNGRDPRPFPVIMEEIYTRADIKIHETADQQRMVDILREAKIAAVRGEKYQLSRARVVLSFLTWAAIGAFGFVAQGAYKWLVDHWGHP